MSETEALFDVDGTIAVLTFNRPQARNALTWAMYVRARCHLRPRRCRPGGPRLRHPRRGRRVRRRHRHQPVHRLQDRRRRPGRAAARRGDRSPRARARAHHRAGSTASPLEAAAPSRSPATSGSARRQRASACRSRARSATASRPRTTRGLVDLVGRRGPKICSSPAASSTPPRRLARPRDRHRRAGSHRRSGAQPRGPDRRAPLTIRATKGPCAGSLNIAASPPDSPTTVAACYASADFAKASRRSWRSAAKFRPATILQKRGATHELAVISVAALVPSS